MPVVIDFYRAWVGATELRGNFNQTQPDRPSGGHFGIGCGKWDTRVAEKTAVLPSDLSIRKLSILSDADIVKL